MKSFRRNVETHMCSILNAIGNQDKTCEVLLLDFLKLLSRYLFTNCYEQLVWHMGFHWTKIRCSTNIWRRLDVLLLLGYITMEHLEFYLLTFNLHVLLTVVCSTNGL